MSLGTMLAAAVAAVGVASAALAAETPAASAAIQTLSVAGLGAKGEIIVDHWGIAHIYGSTTQDAFFLQGYNAARDRLWQIDLWRKRGLGRLSASFGAGYADKDRAARLLLYRGDMASEWAAYPTETRGWSEAFVAGINAFVDEVNAGRRPAPKEFQLTGSRPERWIADDLVRIRSNALVGNLLAEVVRAQSVCHGGLKFETLRHQIEPPHAIVVPAGLDPCSVGPEVVKDYVLGTTGVAFDGRTLVAEAPDARRVALRNDEVTQEGSNNWVVAASHSATGRPILANDPHREHSVPSLRYLVDMSAPGFHIEGAGEPSLPGVSFGHNDTAAWGLTIFYADQQDLYVYAISPDHPDAYRYKGAWEPLRVVHEALEIKGQPSRDIILRFTRHGPVLYEDLAHGGPSPCVQHGASLEEPDTSTLLGCFAPKAGATSRRPTPIGGRRR